jgi:hypothetical protein
MRESRLSGSEGGVPGNGHPYPYQRNPIANLWASSGGPTSVSAV